VKKEDAETFKDMVEAKSIDWVLLGRTTDDGILRIELYDEPVIEEKLEPLEELWKNTLEKALSHTL
jgi:phosphoribosylformylglycinamidine (FGAM) synthase-like enzyme